MVGVQRDRLQSNQLGVDCMSGSRSKQLKWLVDGGGGSQMISFFASSGSSSHSQLD